MYINQIYELSMVLDSEKFKKVLSTVYSRADCLKEIEDECVDQSMAARGITVIFRDSQYKKKIRLIVNKHMVLGGGPDTDKLIRKLDKRISEYFNHRFSLEDFVLSGMNLVTDIDVGNQAEVSAYLKVIKRVGRVKGFSPSSRDSLDDNASFCLSGNSNGIDFLMYDLKSAVTDRIRSKDTGRTVGILRVEVQLTKPKAIRTYTDATSTSVQIAELSEKCQSIFMDTFTHIVPFGDFCKKVEAAEIIQNQVKDTIMRRRMLRLLTLIPEKKSIHLAQKAMNCRDVKKVMDAFAKINLSPVTISKRQDLKQMKNIYTYLGDE